MAKKKNKNKGGGVNKAIKAAGPVLSNKEAKKIAKSTGKSVAQVVAKATSRGTSIGSNLTNKISKASAAPGGSLAQNLGITRANTKTLEALQPLQNLQLNKGTVYSGYSATNTPASNTRTPTQRGGSTYSAGSTTYNPIVLPRGAGGVGGAGGGGGGGGGNGNQNDPYQDLRDQIDQAQQTITDLQNQQADPYPNLDELLAQQQAQAAAQQEAMAAQAAQQQQALQDLMIQQQQAYETQMADARRQQEAMAAEAAEAQRQAMAVQNAYVPGLEPTAAAPALGDARNRVRSAANNTLSNLAILTGLGTSAGVTATPATATPLAGLQIA